MKLLPQTTESQALGQALKGIQSCSFPLWDGASTSKTGQFLHRNSRDKKDILRKHWKKDHPRDYTYTRFWSELQWILFILKMKMPWGTLGFQDFQASATGKTSTPCWAGASQVQTTLIRSWVTEKEWEGIKESKHKSGYTAGWLIKLVITNLSEAICFHSWWRSIRKYFLGYQHAYMYVLKIWYFFTCWNSDSFTTALILETQVGLYTSVIWWGNPYKQFIYVYSNSYVSGGRQRTSIQLSNIILTMWPFNMWGLRTLPCPQQWSSLAMCRQFIWITLKGAEI